jgi:chromosome segregation ATPase
MKYRKILYLLFTILIVSCGSSERVITSDGNVYEINGNTIKNNGIEVTENLSKEKKEAINELLEKKKEAQKVFEQEKKDLEKAISNQRDIQKEAKEKEKELENELDTLEDNFENKLDVKDNFASLKKRYVEKQKEFRKLKKQGELSPNDIKDWKEKLNTLKKKVNKAKAEMNKL